MTITKEKKIKIWIAMGLVVLFALLMLFVFSGENYDLPGQWEAQKEGTDQRSHFHKSLRQTEATAVSFAFKATPTGTK